MQAKLTTSENLAVKKISNYSDLDHKVIADIMLLLIENIERESKEK